MKMQVKVMKIATNSMVVSEVPPIMSKKHEICAFKGIQKNVDIVCTVYNFI